MSAVTLANLIGAAHTSAMQAIDFGHLYVYYFPIMKQRNPSEYVELIFAPRTGSPVRRVLLQDVRLPDPSSIRHHHVWGVVDRIYNRLHDARSDAVEDGGDLIADGPYTILPEADESMLAFEFAFHDIPANLMNRMRIKREGMYRMFVTHPDENRRLALEHPRYSEDVLRLFGDRRRIPVIDRRLLDRANVEFQLAAEEQPINKEIDSFLHTVEPDFQYHHVENKTEKADREEDEKEEEQSR